MADSAGSTPGESSKTQDQQQHCCDSLSAQMRIITSYIPSSQQILQALTSRAAAAAAAKAAVGFDPSFIAETLTIRVRLAPGAAATLLLVALRIDVSAMLSMSVSQRSRKQRGPIEGATGPVRRLLVTSAIVAVRMLSATLILPRQRAPSRI